MIGPVKTSPSITSVLAKLKSPMRNGIDQRDPLRAVGDVDRLRQVVHEDPHDLAESQRDDREIVAAQLERRRAEQHAEHARDRGAQRQDHPERQVEVEMRRREQRVRIRADRVERDVAEVEQPGEADDDVEPQRQQHEQDREIGDPHPRGADRRQRERQRRQRDGDSASPIQAAAGCFFMSTSAAMPAPALRAVGDALAQQPGGPEDEHGDQHQEREHVLVVAAEERQVRVGRRSARRSPSTSRQAGTGW